MSHSIIYKHYLRYDGFGFYKLLPKNRLEMIRLPKAFAKYLRFLGVLAIDDKLSGSRQIHKLTQKLDC